MQLPRIHLNGSDPVGLRNRYIAAMVAVGAAIDAMAAIGVHGRDYYSISAEAIDVAIREHGERITKLGDIYRELQTIAMYIDSEIAERKKRQG